MLTAFLRFHCTCILGKSQRPLHQLPPQQVRNKYGDFPVASPQQVRNKLARAKVRCVTCACCVVSFPKFHYNDSLPTCCGLVTDFLAVSLTSPQQVGSFPAYVEVTGKRTCVIDFGHKTGSGRYPAMQARQLLRDLRLSSALCRAAML